MWAGRIAVGVAIIFSLGCGGEDTGSQAQSETRSSTAPKPSLATKVNVQAVGLAIDDFRGASEAAIEDYKSCADLFRAGGDRASFELCARRVFRAIERAGAVVARSVDDARVEAKGACDSQLQRVGTKFLAAVKVAEDTATKVALNSGGSVSAALDAFDSRFAQLERASARAQNLCGG